MASMISLARRRYRNGIARRDWRAAGCGGNRGLCYDSAVRVSINENAITELHLEADFEMTYIVAEPCVNCRYTDCALVCPVDAFHLDDDMLVINPETCIDCDACVPECPVEAIFVEDKLPAEWASFTQINADRALSGLPTINVRLDPLCQ